jgi:ribosome-associated translation inhibitor RaiA
VVFAFFIYKSFEHKTLIKYSFFIISMSVVRYVGLKALGDQESVVKTLVERYMEKLERDLPYYDMVVHVKLYKEEGKPKYFFQARVQSPDVKLRADAVDWDLRRTVHKVMKRLETEMNHTFKNDAQPQERFHPKKAKRGTDTKVKLRRRL